MNGALWPRIWRHIQIDVYAVGATAVIFTVGAVICHITGWRFDMFMVGWVAFIAIKASMRLDRRHL